MSTQNTPEPIPALRPPAASGGLGTAAFRIAVLLLLAVNAWYLHGIREATTGRSLESCWAGNRDKLSKDTKVMPVYVINGIDVNRIEGVRGDGSYVDPVKIDAANPFGLRIDASVGLPVKVQDQPVMVKVTP
jgi:hypothetical protein